MNNNKDSTVIFFAEAAEIANRLLQVDVAQTQQLREVRDNNENDVLVMADEEKSFAANNNNDITRLKQLLKSLETVVEAKCDEMLAEKLSFGGCSFQEIDQPTNTNIGFEEEEQEEFDNNDLLTHHNQILEQGEEEKVKNDKKPSTLTQAQNHQNQNQNQHQHDILPTQNLKLNQILNGGVRTGNIVEICCGRKNNNNNARNSSSSSSSSFHHYTDEATGERYKFEENHLAVGEDFDGMASIFTALRMMTKSTAVLSLSSKASEMFLQGFMELFSSTTNDNKYSSTPPTSDDIIFEEFTLPPVSISSNNNLIKKSLLDYLPILEAKLLLNSSSSRQGKNIEEDDDNDDDDDDQREKQQKSKRRIEMLMLLDLDSAMNDSITAASILNPYASSNTQSEERQISTSTKVMNSLVFGNNNINNSNNNKTNTNSTKNAGGGNQFNNNNNNNNLLDFYGDKLFAELKKMAVRLNIAIVVVRLKDVSDLNFDAASALASLSQSLFGFDFSSNNSNHVNDKTKTSAKNVGSYHAVNCRIRATTSIDDDVENNDQILQNNHDVADLNSKVKRFSIEICKSAWCATSMNTIKL